MSLTLNLIRQVCKFTIRANKTKAKNTKLVMSNKNLPYCAVGGGILLNKYPYHNRYRLKIGIVKKVL